MDVLEERISELEKNILEVKDKIDTYLRENQILKAELANSILEKNRVLEERTEQLRNTMEKNIEYDDKIQDEFYRREELIKELVEDNLKLKEKIKSMRNQE